MSWYPGTLWWCINCLKVVAALRWAPSARSRQLGGLLPPGEVRQSCYKLQNSLDHLFTVKIVDLSRRTQGLVRGLKAIRFEFPTIALEYHLLLTQAKDWGPWKECLEHVLPS